MTPWDEPLQAAMEATGIAIHEEEISATLLAEAGGDRVFRCGWG
jgi:hypothetical protein